MKARISIRGGAYRDESGYTISGTDTRGRRVRVFVPGSTRAEADIVAGNIRAGLDPFVHIKPEAQGGPHDDRADDNHRGAQR